uniref:Uncharacterized protein n=1 Tax=Mesocestoides corti TaxID=53468 RepID=A0A5K3FG30_MESCO
MKETGLTEQALLTNHKPEPRRSLYTTSQTCLSLVGCLTSSQAIGTQIDRVLAEATVVQNVGALICRCSGLLNTTMYFYCERDGWNDSPIWNELESQASANWVQGSKSQLKNTQ